MISTTWPSHFSKILPIYAIDNFSIRPGKTRDIVMELRNIPYKIAGYKDVLETGVATVAKLKSAKEDQLVQTIIIHLNHDGKTKIQLTNHANIDWKIHKGEMLGCLDMRSSGYFHVSRDTLQTNNEVIIQRQLFISK